MNFATSDKVLNLSRAALEKQTEFLQLISKNLRKTDPAEPHLRLLSVSPDNRDLVGFYRERGAAKPARTIFSFFASQVFVKMNHPKIERNS